MNKKANLILLVPLLFIAFLFLRDKDIHMPFSNKKKPNLIVVQMEAFQSFVLEKDINGKEITPNLNALIKNSVYFPNFYLQNGAGSTSDAEFMFNTSLYPLKPPLVATTGASLQEFNSLPRLLKDEGYKALTFHTNSAVFWNRKELYSALGFDKFYDKKDFEEKDVMAFGSSDDVLYEKTAKILGKQDEPFYAHVISMSGHYPFVLPSKLQTFELPENYKGTMVGDYVEAAHYADAALGRFIQELKDAGKWDNTIFAVYGDHRGIEPVFQNKKDEQAMKDLLGRKYDEVDALKIPFIIHAPDLKPERIERAGGHLDMMPTIASLLDVSLKKIEIFGHNLFENKTHVVGERGHYAPEGTFITNGKYFNPETNTVIDVKTHQKETGDIEKYQKVEKELLDRFKESDKVIAGLPLKKESFGRELTVTEETALYTKPNEKSKINQTIPANTTVDSFDSKDGNWYFIKLNEKEYWIKTKNPIIEGWSFVKVNGEIPLYKEPNKKEKPVMTVMSQNLFVSEEWIGKGWYKVFTWAGKELWAKVE